MNRIMPSRAVYVPAGKDRYQRNLSVWGVAPVEVKVSGADTGGAFALFEHSDLTKGGPPRHYHEGQDEWLYVLQGEFRGLVADQEYFLHPGDSIFIPKRVVHGWELLGDTPGKALFAFSPAGKTEAMFEKAAESDRPPAPEEAARMAAEYGLKIVGPPIDVPWTRHGQAVLKH